MGVTGRGGGQNLLKKPRLDRVKVLVYSFPSVSGRFPCMKPFIERVSFLLPHFAFLVISVWFISSLALNWRVIL